MSKADYQLLNNYLRILTEGENDFDLKVRPKWQDNTPAHTIRVFGAMNRYDLQDEFPISGVRKFAWRACIDEILWIWQKKSNNVRDLNAKIWDQWANKGEHSEQEIGSIGKAYGYQLGKKCIKTKDGNFIDQVDYMLQEIKNNPANRRIITEIFNHAELHEMNLAPCVHQTTWNINNGKLNLFLNQRSHDTLSAGVWNVVQYAALLSMVAQVCGLKAGELVHMVVDSHCYDRHIPMEFEIILHRCSLIQKMLFENNLNNILNNLDDDATKNFLEVISALKNNSDKLDFDKEISKARAVAADKNTNYLNYLNYIRLTPEMSASKTLIKAMLSSPEIDKALGFSTPKLVMDKNVTNFYDFISPRMRTETGFRVENGEFVREGKFSNNPNSSFDIVDYHPEIEGMEFDKPVPVAE